MVDFGSGTESAIRHPDPNSNRAYVKQKTKGERVEFPSPSVEAQTKLPTVSGGHQTLPVSLLTDAVFSSSTRREGYGKGRHPSFIEG
jgi:hypothetical protein